jgi:hypothetical protein
MSMRLGIDFVCGNSAEYHGADAEEVYAVLERTGIRGGNFTGPIRLSSGIYITFMLENIVAFYFTKEATD